MSQQLISRNPDLKRLSDEGYAVEIVGGHLIIRDVPYVTETRRVRRGTLISRLDLAGDRTIAPTDHFVWFSGGAPCDSGGRELIAMSHPRDEVDLGAGLRADRYLCSLPVSGEFRDFYEKMTTFIAQLTAHAQAFDPSITARVHHVVRAPPKHSCFAYVDTASARNSIGAFNDRIAGLNVGIIGLGGTGAYVLDQLAKTPVARIHLVDDDRFEQHNAFRAPGAASVEELQARPTKVAYLKAAYSRMHNGIIAHPLRLGAGNVDLLDHLDFAFVCVDSPVSRKLIVEELERRDMSFIDVGMGLHLTDRGLVGTLRVTTSTPAVRSKLPMRSRIPLAGMVEDDPYSTSTQVADLNMLNAALAVIRWKRLYGFYLDLEHEHHSVFSVDGNHLLNEDLLGGVAA
ncbi:ThiF family adenylyltransferase [Sphingomonas sp. ABOLE]|uniref:ThiF family adenylyltransferase n=1 Tax=Sphingomonas sp. ABOLE TaxID=1985878 RepID=UPI000F7F69E5|nr:ThiF family adenylyltransferase [Sphingomonas sp. ABOLE]RSV41110.1 ThiF family adenylyltransferase [Sphingomonas sp. ABOLE]